MERLAPCLRAACLELFPLAGAKGHVLMTLMFEEDHDDDKWERRAKIGN